MEGNTGRHGYRRFSASPFPAAPGDRHAKGRPALRLSLPSTLIKRAGGRDGNHGSRGGEHGPTWMQTIFRVPLSRSAGGPTREGTTSASPFPSVYPDKARWGKGWGAWGEGEPPFALVKGVPLPPKTTPTTNHQPQTTNTGRQGFGEDLFGPWGRQAAAGQ